MREVMLKILLIGTCLLFLPTSQVLACKPLDDCTVKIVSGNWPGYSETDGSGLYFDVLRLVYESEGIKLSPSVVPFKRAVHQSLSAEIDILLVTRARTLGPLSQTITPKYPISQSITIVLFRKQDLYSWKEILDNPGAIKLAWIRGYDYHLYAPIRSHTLVNDDWTGIKLLASSRIDAYISAEEDIQSSAAELNINLNEQFRSEAIAYAKLYPVFNQSERGHQLLNIYDERMEELIRSGKINELYQRYNLDYSELLPISKKE
ncbi:ABC transporter substrate-binding protein [Maricurvus nonylphenolicus]|uniref:substrate-binding periplasmic protein n=1 Tax=Maricurvus nonylphenolicus TaxID=1008307 RepID=UPI0036F35F29